MPKLNINISKLFDILIVCIVVIPILFLYNKLLNTDLSGRKIHHFYNKYHYGDNIFNLKFLFNISNILKEKNIVVYYYYNSSYIKNTDELKRYIDSDAVKLLDLKYKPYSAIEFWMGDTENMNIHPREMDSHMNNLYKNMLNELKLENLGIDISIYQKEDYLQDIKLNKDNLQCLIGEGFIPFGHSQKPNLNDYADGVDTMKFLIDD